MFVLYMCTAVASKRRREGRPEQVRRPARREEEGGSVIIPPDSKSEFGDIELIAGHRESSSTLFRSEGRFAR